jgi:hypothetical protein
MPPKKPAAKNRTQQPELRFQAEVIALCEGRDLWPVIVNPARFAQRTAGNQGFPDLMIYGPGGVIWRELKTDAGMAPGRGLSTSQVTWRDRLRASGQDWDVWTPRDLRAGHVGRQLAAIETPAANADTFTLAMLGVQADTAPAADIDDDDGQDDAPGNRGADSATMRKTLPWLLAGGMAIAAVIVINRG